MYCIYRHVIVFLFGVVQRQSSELPQTVQNGSIRGCSYFEKKCISHRDLADLFIRQSSPCLHSLSACSKPCWARQKPRRNLIYISHVSGKHPGSLPITFCLPGCSEQKSITRSTGRTRHGDFPTGCHPLSGI